MEEVVKGMRGVIEAWTHRTHVEETATTTNTMNKNDRPATIGQMKKLL